MAAGIVGFAGWVGYSSVNVFYRDAMLEARDRRIAELSQAYDRLAADFDKNQESFLVASRDLEERYHRLYDMAMKQRIPAEGGAPAAANGGEAKVAAKPKDAAKDVKMAAAPAPATAPAPALAPAVAAAPAEDKKTAGGKADDKQTEVASAATSDADDTTASSEDLEGMLRESKATRPPLPEVKPGDLETRLLALRSRQRELLDDLAQRTEASVAKMEKALALTGLDINAMLARAAEARADVGVGGPLRTLGTPEKGGNAAAVNGVAVASASTQFDRDVMAVEGNLSHWGDLLALAQRLPLALPMTGDVERSSGFGRRLDPFTKQWAYHAGIDFIGPLRSPIIATAPGVVVFAGRKGPYGRTVEIDHGLGIKTRYAHMSSITVQTGDTVAYGRQVGTMGSTGRSTGQHLHYEILLDGEQIEPGKFIEAGYHVFKQQEDQSAARK